VQGTCPSGYGANAAYHTPKGIWGVADLPGAYGLFTLGFSPDFVGSEFFQASTTMHELGHNLRLWHSGEEPVFTPAPKGRVNLFLPPQCKPHHPSIISYLYQMNGLIDAAGKPHIDYSGNVFGLSGGPVQESALSDSVLLPEPAPFRTAWYAPLTANSLGVNLQVPAATKHCDGSPKAANENFGRLETNTVGAIIDWDGLPELEEPAN
jgi:hypothetical protein